MSELKAFEVNGKALFGRTFTKEAYYKEEADKVLAEKDKEITELQKQVHDYAQGLYVIQARAENEIRHQKYKRCLAMARWCASRVVVWATEGNEKKSDWYWKWKGKWRELAEKFKPNKEAK